MNQKNNQSEKLTRTHLFEQLAQHNFLVKPEHQESLWNWVQFFADRVEQLPDLVAEIISLGQCAGCSLPEYVIEQEKEAGDGRNHLICAGCQQVCEEGTKYRDQDYYSFHSPRCGAYVFWQRNEPIEEWYCQKCKFDLLCADCGTPHQLDTNLFTKPKSADFYCCPECQVERAEAEHEQHAWKPNLTCQHCQSWAEQWSEQQLASQNFPIKEFLLKNSWLVEFNRQEKLNPREKVKQRRIYDCRDQTFRKISEQLARYYETAIKGDYRYAGMPGIAKGLRGWLESKIWQLLVVLGEPNHLRYQTTDPDFWIEAE